MTPHEKECALAAIAVRIESARKDGNRKELADWIKFRREIILTPVSATIGPLTP